MYKTIALFGCLVIGVSSIHSTVFAQSILPSGPGGSGVGPSSTGSKGPPYGDDAPNRYPSSSDPSSENSNSTNNGNGSGNTACGNSKSNLCSSGNSSARNKQPYPKDQTYGSGTGQ